MTAEIPTNTDALAAMLEDPEIRQSLAVIVANAPTLAALTSMASGLLQRGPELTDNINGLVNDLRGETSGDGSSIGSAIAVGAALGARKDAITNILDSDILDSDTVEVIGNLGAAAAAADAKTQGHHNSVGGIFAIMRELKDPQVQNTLAFLIEFAKVFGERQAKGH